MTHAKRQKKADTASSLGCSFRNKSHETELRMFTQSVPMARIQADYYYPVCVGGTLKMNYTLFMRVAIFIITELCGVEGKRIWPLLA